MDGEVMPTYEFRCVEGHVTEEFRHMSDCSRPRVCFCGQPAERIMSASMGIVRGGTRGKPLDYRASLGRTFDTVQDLDQHLTAKGLVRADSSPRSKPRKRSEITVDEVAREMNK